MASKKLVLSIDDVQRKLKALQEDVASITQSNVSDDEKKNGLFVMVRKSSDLILDARSIYFDAKSTKIEGDFDFTKLLLTKCVQFQNEIFANIIAVVEIADPFTAFRYDGAIMENNNYIKRIQNEKINSSVRYF